MAVLYNRNYIYINLCYTIKQPSLGGGSNRERRAVLYSSPLLYLVNVYEYNNENQMYWHVRHSHLYPVKKQHFLLDFDNNINENNINNILQLLQ